MALPDYQSLMRPLLEIASDGEIHTVRAIKETLADQLGISEEDRRKLLPSGTQEIFYNRVHWAKTYLKQAGLLEQIKRGQFKISDRGRELLDSSNDPITNETLKQYPEFNEFKSKSSTDSEESTVSVSSELQDEQTPEEALQIAHQRLRNELAAELLENIGEMSPEFFERLVLRLMVSMGYGGARESSASMTASGSDEGIDGIINEDQLGLDLVYLQAKRWQNPVGRPEIQKFVGALHGKRAKKGVFITTSSFSRDALDYVEHLDPKVVLVDGKRLAALMIDFDVGVSTAESFHVKKIDTDFFTED